MRDSFIFYRSFYEAIRDLPRDIQGEIYTAIMEYSLYGNETDNLKPVARSIFTLIKPQIDINNKRYANGKKGGRPSDLQHDSGGNRQDGYSENITEEKPNNNQTQTKAEPNDNVNDNDNKESLNRDSMSETCSCKIDKESNGDYFPVCDHPLEVNEERKSSGKKKDAIDWDELIHFFNNEAKGAFCAIRSPLSESRKRMVKARISEYGKEAFGDMIRRASRSDFLKGGNNSGFKATFDWLIKPSNFSKVLEGNYDNTLRTDSKAVGKPEKRTSTL